MKDKVLAWCCREHLIRPGDRVVCALSGGADSVAMTHCLLSLADELQIQVSAAHYNHCLRGEASDSDEVFVRRLCASWGIPLEADRGDVAAYAQTHGQSLEEAARCLRYEFLRHQSGLIAVAHNADDQVETVLLNLIRGTGLKGLASMEPKRDRIIRPLLSVSRTEIEAYLQAHNLPHREDHTNGEDEALRNRLRHHVVPLLRQENPALSQTVGRMTALLRADEAYLARETEALLAAARRQDGYDCQTLLEAPSVLRRRAIRVLLQIPKPSQIHVDQAEALLSDLSGSAQIQLPGGFTMVREYGLLRLERKTFPADFLPVCLHPGENAVLEGTDLEIFVEGPVILEKTYDSLSTFALKYDMMGATPTLWIRPRQTGDVLRLSGGTRSLKKLMIDRKIPAARRGLIPVITDGETILAVYGLGSDIHRTARPGDRALIVKLWHRGEKQP